MITRRIPILISQFIRVIDWKEILLGGAGDSYIVVLSESQNVYTGKTKYYASGFNTPESTLKYETKIPEGFHKIDWCLYAFSHWYICLSYCEDGKTQYLLYDRQSKHWKLIIDRENNKFKEFETQADNETECFTPIRCNLYW